MAMTPLPTPPSRQDPANFAVRGDALMAALPLFVAEANALQEDVAVKQSIASSAVDMAMANGNYKGLWSSLTGALAIPASVQYGGFVWMLLSNVSDVTAEQPGVSAAWMKIESAGNLGTAAYSNNEDFQAAFGELTGIVRANGDGTVSPATAAQIVAAIGLTAVAYATASTTSGSCSGNAATATVSASCSGNAATATSATTSGDASNLGGIPAANYLRLVNAVPAVRQTVLSGPVDSSGYSSFGGATGGSVVTASGTLTVTAAAGGNNNRTGSVTNPSWTGLSTNGTMYLYLDIAADGTCTPGSTTMAPVYQWGGTYSPTNGQFTYNIQEGTGKVGNGTTSDQVYRVFVGDVTVSGGVVSAITWYALNGKCLIAASSLPSAGAAVNKTHNLGIIPNKCPTIMLTCTGAESGFSVGDTSFVIAQWNGSVTSQLNTWSDKKSCGFNLASGFVLMVENKTNGAGATATNWTYSLAIDRGW